MLIAVRPDRFTEHYIEVPKCFDEDTARKIAFRFVAERREKDYNELVHTTQPIRLIKELSEAEAQLLLSHVK